MLQVFYISKNNAFYVINIDNLLVSGWSFSRIITPLHTPTATLMHHINNNTMLIHLQAVNPQSVIVDLGTYKSINAIIDSNPHLLV